MRLGIVGCGLAGGKRAAAAVQGSHRVVTVCDRDAARAERLAATVGAKAVRDWREVIGADLDMVIVATSHDTLAEISIAAVSAGKHVLVEKPAARTHAEAEALRDAAARHGRLVKVGFNHRYHPGLLEAYKMVREGAIGPLMFIRARYGHGGRVGYEKEWRCVPEVSGGGELVDQGSHLIDLARWFLGELRLDYGAAVTCFWDALVDDNCFLALRGPRGEMAWLHASWSEWKNLFSFEIYGRSGKLAVEGLGGSYGSERLTWHRMLPQMGPPETTVQEYDSPDLSWARELEEFVAAIGENRRPAGDMDDAVALHALIRDIYRRNTR